MHIRTQILDELLVRVLGLPLTGTRVRVDPTDLADESDLPGLTLRSGNEAESVYISEIGNCADTARSWAVELEIRTATPAEVGLSIDVPAGSRLANDILAEVLPAIFTDTTLGNLVTRMELGPVAYAGADAEHSLSLLTATLLMEYAYNLSDPTTPITP